MTEKERVSAPIWVGVLTKTRQVKKPQKTHEEPSKIKNKKTVTITLLFCATAILFATKHYIPKIFPEHPFYLASAHIIRNLGVLGLVTFLIGWALLLFTTPTEKP